MSEYQLRSGNPADNSRLPVCDIGVLQHSEKFYRLECISSIEAIEAIEADWRKLEQSDDEPFTYFQSYNWCYDWCVKQYKNNPGHGIAQAKIYALWCDARLLMLWPMMAKRSYFGIKVLTFLTEPLGQYGNILVDRTQVPLELGPQIWKLICRDAEVDAITINQYPSTSSLDELLGDVGIAEQSSKAISFLDLSQFESWDEHHKSLSASARKQRNRRRNKLAKAGVVDYEVIPGGSPRYARLVDKALQMKQIWLQQTGRRADILSKRCTASFLTGLSGKAGSNERPAGSFAHALTLNGEPIAIEIGMVEGDHYYSYLGAFDWKWRDYSPGKIQIELAQKWAKEAGLRTFDFLGDPSEYKSQWTNSTRSLNSRSVPRSLLGWLYCVVWKAYLRGAVRTAYHHLGSERRKLLLKLLGLGARQNTATPKAGSLLRHSKTGIDAKILCAAGYAIAELFIL
ncbi:MAG: GNAT family N-acetyltransferase [Stappiaceae bacterium]